MININKNIIQINYVNINYYPPKILLMKIYQFFFKKNSQTIAWLVHEKFQSIECNILLSKQQNKKGLVRQKYSFFIKKKKKNVNYLTI